MSKIEAAVLTACALLASVTPVAARPGGWGGPGWGDSGWRGAGGSAIDSRFRDRYDDSREGRVEASHFVVEAMPPPRWATGRCGSFRNRARKTTWPARIARFTKLR